jgi:NAD(P)-dependent dehydrogenase (short-subunit alcohol dehydrogenase family)
MSRTVGGSKRVALVAGATRGAGRGIAVELACAGWYVYATGRSSCQLADAYGITDTDGSRPDCWGYLAAFGWERDDGAGIEDFR